MERGAGRSTEYWVSLALLRVGLAALAIVVVLNRQAAPLHALIAANEDDEIVYIDPDGFIHVVDPRPSSTVLQVQWVSPDGGWAHIAAGDYNADGDAEIAAVRPAGDGSILTVFDPVAPDVPDGHDRVTAGVPWNLLYSRPVSSTVSALASGDFDLDRPGDEILFSRFLPEADRRDGDDRGRVTILRQPRDVSSGREWEEMATYDSEFDWTWAASGNVDGAGQDEVALVDDNTGTLSALRVNLAGGRLVPFFSNSNRDHTWLRAAVGQYVGGGAEEIAAVRDAEFPLPSFWLFRYENGALVDHQWEAFLPSPSMVFFGDLAGNGDEEAIILRSVRPEAGSRARLIIRNSGDETLGMREALLDGDNGYLTGAAGDLDADGRDEIAIMRDYRIRIYTQPERNSAYEEILTPTNSDDIAVGNVDANGLASASQLAASRNALAVSLDPGAESSAMAVAVSDATNSEAVPVTVRVEGGSAWVEVSPTNAHTPFTLTVRFDSTGLGPGVYRDRILVDAQTAGVMGDPMAIALALTVESGVTTVPEVVLFDYYPCEEPLEVRSLPLAVEGETGIAYRASLEGDPAWLEVNPTEGQLPGTLTLTADPALRTDDYSTANLVLSLDLPGAPGTVQRVPVVLACASSQLHLPYISSGSR